MTSICIHANTDSFPGIASWACYSMNDDSDMAVFATMTHDGVMDVFMDYGIDGPFYGAVTSLDFIAFDLGMALDDRDLGDALFHERVVPMLIRGLVMGEVIKHSEMV